MPGLGVLPGRIQRLPDGVKRPQMQWNQLLLSQPDHPLVAGLGEEPWVYFVHSYAAPGAAAGRGPRWWRCATTEGRWWLPWPPGRCGRPSSIPRSPVPPVWESWPTSWPRRQVADGGGTRPSTCETGAACGWWRATSGRRRSMARTPSPWRPPSPPRAPGGSMSWTWTRPGRVNPSTAPVIARITAAAAGWGVQVQAGGGVRDHGRRRRAADRGRGARGGRDGSRGATRTWSERWQPGGRGRWRSVSTIAAVRCGCGAGRRPVAGRWPIWCRWRWRPGRWR